jgi:cytochrome P450
MTEVLFNPLEPGFTDDPYRQYSQLRELDPAHEHPLGFWFLTSYDAVAALLRAGLSVEVRNLGDGLVRDQYDQISGHNDQSVLVYSMLDRDPPDHTRLRSLVTKVFTPRAVAALEPRIVTLVDQALDRIADARHADLVDELAFPLPFAVISEMLGMPDTDHARVRELSGTVVLSLEVVADEATMIAIAKAGVELSGIISELINWKRRNPGDDLISALISAEHEGQVLSDDELVAQVSLLYIAGHETTVSLISNGVLALLRNPDQLELLRSRPDLAGNAIEEFLRYDSPVQQSRRITTSPYPVGDKEIPPGAFVVACLAAANRDSRFFGPDADQLRLERPDARGHVSFGAGPHHCLGAALARLEGRVAIERLVARFPGLALDGEIVRNGRINLRGLNKLPISV